MNIGFDAKRAFLNYTGLGNYSRETIAALAGAFPRETYYLYTPAILRNSRTELFFERDNMVIRQPRMPVLKSLWRTGFVVRQLKKDRLDIFHGLSHEIPLGIGKSGIPAVVTIHDLIFLRYPQYYKPADRKIYEAKYRYACKRADRIIAISEQTKRDIQSFFGIDPAKITVIYQACDPAFAQERDAGELSRIRQKYGLPERFILNVGTVEERKNALLAAKALTMLPEELKLVVIGRHTAYAGTVKKYLAEHKLEARVIFLENIPFEDLPGLYRLAEVFVYPSRFEGFGIPVLEALSSGVPVVAASGSSLEEAGGSGSLYVHPDDAESLAGHILGITGNPALREKIISAGHFYAAGFSSVLMAKRLMALYKELC